jgi:hypothetical protein
MHRSRSLLPPAVAFAGLVSLSVGIAACRDQTEPTSPQPHVAGGHEMARQDRPVSGDVQRQIARLRAATAQFHDFDRAVEAGWSAPIPDCFSDPVLGGMGYHYGNPALIDGTVEALEPELLVYEPRKNGELRFVAVEYIVPYDAWTSAEPPTLYGQSFHRNDAFDIWVLHVWHFRNNPSGMFADWNPRVSCEFATN